LGSTPLNLHSELRGAELALKGKQKKTVGKANEKGALLHLEERRSSLSRGSLITGTLPQERESRFAFRARGNPEREKKKRSMPT